MPAHQRVCGRRYVAGAAAPIQESQHQAIREPAHQVPILRTNKLRETVQENLHTQIAFGKPCTIRMGAAFGDTWYAAALW